MASEAHNGRKQKVLHIEGHPTDLPRKRISSSTKKIMKEVSSGVWVVCFIFVSSEAEVKVQQVYGSEQSRMRGTAPLAIWCLNVPQNLNSNSFVETAL